jgi:hypothetical protein
MATTSRRLYGSGAIMMAALIACARIKGPVGSPLYLSGLGLAATAYLFALRELMRAPKYPRHVVVICLAMGAAWRVPFLLVPPGPQDDVLRYVWDGRLRRFGYNPYTVIPDDPALAKLHTPETREMNNADLPSPYPPGAQLFFRTVTAIHESAFAFKVAFAICDLAILLLLLAELRQSGLGEHWALAYAWHPLLVPCVAYNAHIDILGALLLLISAMSLRRHWRAFAAVTFGMAIAVKFLPAVLAPLYWRRVRIRDGLLAAILFALLYVPFVHQGTIPLGSLGAFVQRFRFNDPIFAVIERAVRPRPAASLAVLSGICSGCFRFCAQGLPPAHRLDAEHPLCLLRLVFARVRRTLEGSRLDSVAGVRIGCHGHSHRRQTTSGAAVALSRYGIRFSPTTGSIGLKGFNRYVSVSRPSGRAKTSLTGPMALHHTLEAGTKSYVRDGFDHELFARPRLPIKLSTANGPAPPITRAARQARYNRITS